MGRFRSLALASFLAAYFTLPVRVRPGLALEVKPRVAYIRAASARNLSLAGETARLHLGQEGDSEGSSDMP